MKYAKQLKVRTLETILWPMIYQKNNLCIRIYQSKIKMCNKIIGKKVEKIFTWNITKYDIYNTKNSQTHENIKA